MTKWDEAMTRAVEQRNKANALIDLLNSWKSHGIRYATNDKAEALSEIKKLAADFDGSLPAPPPNVVEES